MKFFYKGKAAPRETYTLYRSMKKWYRDDKRSSLGKVYLTMKLTVFLLIMGTLQVVGETTYAQSVSIHKKDATLLEVLQSVRKQTGFLFICDLGMLENAKTVNINMNNASIKDVLDASFAGQSLTYSIVDKTIIVKQKKELLQKSLLKAGFKEINTTPSFSENKPNMIAMLDSRITSARNLEIVVKGKVSDEKGESLPGVSILVKGTQRGTVTDVDGKYSLTIPDNNATLVFSFVGFHSQEVIARNNSALNIVLKADMKALEEVVVVGYGVQKKINLTGAVNVISGEQLQNRQASTLSQILQGQSPGLNFSVGDSGFEPGASMGVNIRGMGSLNGGSPLVIIDGIPGSMDRLNPEDVESISVLKDAAASAIYGARAPYGVIVITTKSGKKNTKLTVSYSGNVSLNQATRLPTMLDSYDFAKVINEMGVNAGGRTYDNLSIDRILAYKQGDIEFLKKFSPANATHFETIPQPSNPNRWGNNNASYANYDWYDEWYGQSINNNHNLSIRGGSEKTAYSISGGFVTQNGVLNYGTDTFKRFNLAAKINTSVTKWWDFGFETRFMKSPREHFNGKYGHGYTSIYREIPRTVATQAKYDGFGNYSMESKIRWAEDAGTDKNTTTENWNTFTTEFRPLKGWKINGNFAYKTQGYIASNVDLAVNEPYLDGSIVQHGETLPSQVEQIQETNTYWTTNLYTSYDLQIGKKHNISTMVGTQWESNDTRRNTATKINLIVPEIPSLQTANGDATVSESLSQWTTQGYFARVAYNFMEKYLFEANARYDGTSRFKSGSRWGFFPSFSVGWNVDREKFWQSIEPYVNTLKFRGSWGQLGNQNVTQYMDLSLIPLQTAKLDWIFNYGQNRPIGYTSTPNLVSPNLTWETSTTKNLGLNASFLKSRLQLDFDVFERVTKNMIGPSEPVPGILGATVPSSNNATMRTRGWEASLRWNQNLGKNLSYFVTLNLQDDQSVILDYLNPSGSISDWYAGKKVGEIWGYTANDLFKTQEEVDSYLKTVNLTNIYSVWNPGDLKYLDVNGDGRVNNGANSLTNPGDLSIIGNSTPRYQYGINAGFNIKGFDFSFLIKGTGKRDYTIPTSGEQYVFWGVQNWLFTAMTTQHLDYFRDKPGDKYTGLYEGEANINLDSYWPRTYLDANQNAKNRRASTRYLLNAAYLRLQNVQLGYNVSPQVLDKIGFQKLRVYVSGENLFTSTSLLKNIDPVALGSAGRIGMTSGANQMFSIGVNATF